MNPCHQDLHAAYIESKAAGAKDSMALRLDDSMCGSGTRLPITLGHLRWALLRIEVLEQQIAEAGCDPVEGG
jgi:hypothetical protein